MRVAIMSAIPGELEALRHLGDAGLVAVEAGIGKVNAAAATADLIAAHGPDVVLFTGVAGGLDPSLSVGDIVIGSLSRQHDTGVATDEGLDPYPAGHLPFFNPTDQSGHRPSARLLATARAVAERTAFEPVLGRHPTVVSGTILTGDQFVDSSIVRDRLYREFEASAVEMEGDAVAQVAASRGVDCLVVRALSDLAGGDAAFDFAEFLEPVAANSARLALGIRAALSLG